MEILAQYSALWTLTVFILIGLFFLIKGLFGYRRIGAEAGEEYDFRRTDSNEVDKISRDGFVRAYRRFYGPRSQVYRGLSILAAAFLTLPALVFFEYAGEQVWNMIGKPYEFGPSTLIWRFMLFFGMIAFWALVFFISATIYHKNAPRTFKDELLRESD